MGNLFPVAKIIRTIYRIVFVRENKFEHSPRDKLSKPGRYISNKPRLRNIQLSQQKAGQSLNHFERIGREIDNFRLPGLPSLKDIRTHFDQTLEREEKKSGLIEKNQDFDQALRILIDLKNILENSTTEQISGFKSRVDEFTDFQMSVIPTLIREIHPLIKSRSQIEELINIVGDPANVLKDIFAHFDQQDSRSTSSSSISEVMDDEDTKIIQNEYLMPKSSLDNLKETFDISEKESVRHQDQEQLLSERNDESMSSHTIFDFFKPPAFIQTENHQKTETKSPLDSLLEGLEKSELGKLKELVDKTVADTSNMTVIRDTLDTLGSISGETINNTQLLIKVNRMEQSSDTF